MVMTMLWRAISFTVRNNRVRSRDNQADVLKLAVLHTKAVGVQYYTGYASVGEYVLVRREPSNPYDSNALRVENVQRDQIGHIPRAIAAKLAKYMVIFYISCAHNNANHKSVGFRRSLG